MSTSSWASNISNPSFFHSETACESGHDKPRRAWRLTSDWSQNLGCLNTRASARNIHAYTHLVVFRGQTSTTGCGSKRILKKSEIVKNLLDLNLFPGNSEAANPQESQNNFTAK
jgi:hypothetical protein